MSDIVILQNFEILLIPPPQCPFEIYRLEDFLEVCGFTPKSSFS